eukprot:TRINITY_DN2123_c0_g1_i1.p2 TRINITY_DN2123_c0_g1~~TRINITY_DN2123_c0_g1_i1.p2  ORF type:complete len:357 (-),score=84.53 TRINITY_DN2123_c0_g1_i1:1646-2716(-)
MSLYALPVAIFNLGGEMLYILQHRLLAQNIPMEKGYKVMQDIVKSMFTTRFVEEVFKPQDMYPHSSVRTIFDRLAHSSIMRLSESSMEKLYDLMTMGFKLQLTRCRTPKEIMQVTENHLKSMVDLVNDTATAALIENVRQNFAEKYSHLTIGDYSLLRQTLLQFFLNRRIKVSLFLQEGLQNKDGSIVLDPTPVMPSEIEVPGSIKLFDDSGSIVEICNFPYQGNAKPCIPNYESTLGMNLYAGHHRMPFSPMDSHREDSSPFGDPSAVYSRPSPGSKSATAELNMLADLIGNPKGSSSDFKILNLFEEEDLSSSSGGTTIVKAQRNVMDVRKLVSDMSVSGSGKQDDLLDLLDKS